MVHFKVKWTLKASTDLREIYKFYSKKSKIAADKIVNQLLDAPAKIRFEDQYRKDDYNPKYRRLLVGDFRILYRCIDTELIIFGVIHGAQDPRKISKY